jgi:hypothetical protein
MLSCARVITSNDMGRLTEPYAMKAYWGSGVQLHAFLTSALDGGEWSTSRLGSFTPKEKSPGCHWITGWVGPRAGLDTVVKGNILNPGGTRNPDHPARIAQRYTTELSRFLNGEYIRIWKESMVTYFKVLFRHEWERLNITTKILNHDSRQHVQDSKWVHSGYKSSATLLHRHVQ